MIRAILDRLARRRCGPSLMRMLFPLVLLAVATTVLFGVIRDDDPDVRGLSLLARLYPPRLFVDISGNMLEIVVLITLMMIGVYLTLHIGLRPLRRAKRAGRRPRRPAPGRRRRRRP